MSTKKQRLAELNKLESKVISNSASRKMTKSEKLSDRITIMIIMVAVVGALSAIGFFTYKQYIEDQANKQEFVELRETLETIRSELQKKSPKGVNWAKVSTRCSYSPGVGLQNGAWICQANTSSQLDNSASQADRKKIAFSLENISNDFVPRSTKESIEKQLNTSDSISNNYQIRHTNIFCDFELIFGGQESSLSCSGSAKKSWYPNREIEHVQGFDAWKELDTKN